MPRMKTLWILTLLALILAACGPGAAPTEAEATAVGLPETLAALPTESATQPPATVTESAAPMPAAVATSRGPNLEATDPATVQLASGSLHLVEFFRFT